MANLSFAAVMQKAAANRVRLLAEIDHTLKDLVGAGACPKLLGMLKPDIDAGKARQHFSPLPVTSIA